MRKIVSFVFIIVLIGCFFSKKEEVLIPNNAIRIRVIANSNDFSDQENKVLIKNEVTNLLYSKLKNVDNYDEAEIIVKNNITNVQKILNKFTDDYEINYGKNYFPSKEYKGVKYDEGNYESLVIKLGEGKGHNFWCVLFPPLCMIDESKLNNVSYSFFVSELLNRIK